MNRREFLRIGATSAIGAAVLLGASSLVGREVRRIIESAGSQTNEETLLQEVARLNIKPSPKEYSLWRSYEGMYLKAEYTTKERAEEETRKQIEAILSRMRQSENPYFRETVETIETLTKRRKLNFTVAHVPLYLNPNNTLSLMGTSLEIKNGIIAVNLGVSADLILKNSKPIDLALALVHETEHAINMLTYQESLSPLLSLEEKLQKEIDRSNNLQELVDEEARGYGKEAIARIHEIGLGYREKGSEAEEEAIAFIKCGGNISNACWKDYVRKEILGLPELTTPTPSSP